MIEPGGDANPDCDIFLSMAKRLSQVTSPNWITAPAGLGFYILSQAKELLVFP